MVCPLVRPLVCLVVFPCWNRLWSILSVWKPAASRFIYKILNYLDYYEPEQRFIPDCLERRSSYGLRMGEVNIHVTGTQQEKREKIINSGLFDETRIESVATTDHARLQRFAQFNAAHGDPGDYLASHFFKNFQDWDMESEYMPIVRNNWLKFRWNEAKVNNKVTSLDEGDVWEFWDKASGLPDKTPNYNKPKLAHPWTIGVLNKMPKMNPVYKIRLCMGGRI